MEFFYFLNDFVWVWDDWVFILLRIGRIGIEGIFINLKYVWMVLCVDEG